MAKKKSEHYVNNKQLLEALIVYRAKVATAKEEGKPKPRITNYLGEVRTELKRVNWPTYSTLTSFTLVTIITIAFFTIFIFGMDFSFKNSLINLLTFGE